MAPVARILRIRSRVISDSLRVVFEKGVSKSRRRGEKRRRNGDEPPANGLELFGIVNGDVNSEVHTSLLKVHVETGNLGSGDLGLHGCRGRKRERESANHSAHPSPPPSQPIQNNQKPERTLTSNGTVESITLNKDGLCRTLSMSLQNVDGLDGVFDITTRVDGLYCQHGFHCHVCEEGVVAVEKGGKRHRVSKTRSNGDARTRVLSPSRVVERNAQVGEGGGQTRVRYVRSNDLT